MLKRFWQFIVQPTSRWSLGLLILIGIIFGLILSISFDATMHATSTDEFCIRCHEINDNVGQEVIGTTHDINATGIKATCASCHVPKAFGPMMVRKVESLREIYHHFKGTLDTPEKFEDHRLRMANRVWHEMQANDSRECRTCHTPEKMVPELQSPKAVEFHEDALVRGKTCIDCHKGLVHKLPRELIEEAANPGKATE
ncbi:MAG: nitrate/TMAO reductase-like tetraheme cytochrome c subunit [Candidatus Krumholzibacteriia bacterium]|jgi:nitrate/TMAO reductase-like tetraheme cytochrome c subunit